MSFAPVKSNPYRSKSRKRLPAFRLWPDDFWDAISRKTDGTKSKRKNPTKYDGKTVFDMICNMNLRMYGKK